MESAEAALAEMREARMESETVKRRKETLRCLVLLRRGEYEKALASSVGLLAGGRDEADLLAIRFEAAHHLHRPLEGGELGEQALERLRRGGYGAWVDRLLALPSLT